MHKVAIHNLLQALNSQLEAMPYQNQLFLYLVYHLAIYFSVLNHDVLDH
jgi:hypothetical protein